MPVLMSSRSTDVQGGFGGWQGRKLQTGDLLPVGKKNLKQLKTRGVLLPILNQEVQYWLALRRNNLHHRFRMPFSLAGWKITADSNRMGFRLEGDTLIRRESGDLLSHGVFPGTIQYHRTVSQSFWRLKRRQPVDIHALPV